MNTDNTNNKANTDNKGYPMNTNKANTMNTNNNKANTNNNKANTMNTNNKANTMNTSFTNFQSQLLQTAKLNKRLAKQLGVEHEDYLYCRNMFLHCLQTLRLELSPQPIDRDDPTYLEEGEHYEH